MFKKAILIISMISISLLLPAQKIVVGSCYTHDGGLYKGEMQSGKPHGKGQTSYGNGDNYEGEYVKGRRQGDGTCLFANGERYEGTWYRDQKHGVGTYSG